MVFLNDTTTYDVVTAKRLVSTIAIGTAPLSVTSTTLVSNLNADLLDGQEGSWYSNITARLGYTPVNKAGDTGVGVIQFNTGIELGLTGDNVSSAPYIDFHYNSGSMLGRDYNVRIINDVDKELRFSAINAADNVATTPILKVFGGGSTWYTVYHSGNLPAASLTGSGTVGTIPLWTTSTTNLGDSIIVQRSATQIGINVTDFEAIPDNATGGNKLLLGLSGTDEYSLGVGNSALLFNSASKFIWRNTVGGNKTAMQWTPNDLAQPADPVGEESNGILDISGDLRVNQKIVSHGPYCLFVSASLPYRQITNTSCGYWDTAYTHSQIVTGNPHGTTAANVGAEPTLPTCPTDNYILSSLANGTKSWVAQNSMPSVVSVSQGGTGATTLTAHGVLIGNGTSAVAITAAGTAGQLLKSGGASADPTWATIGYADVGALAAGGKAADSSLLNAAADSTTATANTIVKRTSGAGIVATTFTTGTAGTNQVAIGGDANNSKISLVDGTSGPYIDFSTDIRIIRNAARTLEILNPTTPGSYPYLKVSDGTNHWLVIHEGNKATYTEAPLGTPAGNGYLLASTTGGTRSWVSNTAGTVGAEPALGNPSVTGYVLSSTTGGTRSWVAQTSVPAVIGLSQGGTNNNNSPAYTSGKFLAYDGSKLASTSYDNASFLGATAKAADSSLLNAVAEAVVATASTIVKRGTSGEITGSSINTGTAGTNSTVLGGDGSNSKLSLVDGTPYIDFGTTVRLIRDGTNALTIRHPSTGTTPTLRLYNGAAYTDFATQSWVGTNYEPAFGVLSVAKGGTNNTAFTTGKFVASNGAGLASTTYDASSFIAAGAMGSYLPLAGGTMSGVILGVAGTSTAPSFTFTGSGGNTCGTFYAGTSSLGYGAGATHLWYCNGVLRQSIASDGSTMHQGACTFYAPGGTTNYYSINYSTNADLSTNSGAIYFKPATGITKVFGSSGTNAVTVSHNNTDGTVSSNGWLSLTGTSGISLGCSMQPGTDNSYYLGGQSCRFVSGYFSGGLYCSLAGNSAAYTGITASGLTASGDVWLTPASGGTKCYVAGTQSTLAVYSQSGGSYYLSLTHNNSYAQITSGLGDLYLMPATGVVRQYTPGVNSALVIYGSGGSNNVTLTHDNGNGWLSTSAGVIFYSPANGVNYFYKYGATSQITTFSSDVAQTLTMYQDTANAVFSNTLGSFVMYPTSGYVIINKSSVANYLQIYSSNNTDYIKLGAGALTFTGNLTLQSTGGYVYTYGHLTPQSDASFQLGTGSNRWTSLYLSGNLNTATSTTASAVTAIHAKCGGTALYDASQAQVRTFLGLQTPAYTAFSGSGSSGVAYGDHSHSYVGGGGVAYYFATWASSSTLDSAPMSYDGSYCYMARRLHTGSYAIYVTGVNSYSDIAIGSSGTYYHNGNVGATGSVTVVTGLSYNGYGYATGCTTTTLNFSGGIRY